MKKHVDIDDILCMENRYCLWGVCDPPQNLINGMRLWEYFRQKKVSIILF